MVDAFFEIFALLHMESNAMLPLQYQSPGQMSGSRNIVGCPDLWYAVCWIHYFREKTSVAVNPRYITSCVVFSVPENVNDRGNQTINVVTYYHYRATRRTKQRLKCQPGRKSKRTSDSYGDRKVCSGIKLGSQLQRFKYNLLLRK